MFCILAVSLEPRRQSGTRRDGAAPHGRMDAPHPQEQRMHYAVDRIHLAKPALDARFTARVQDAKAPASAYALALAGDLIASDGFADESVAPRPGPDTAFRIASCTKSFTAAAALQLRDAGLLDLDAPIDAYLDVAVVGGPMPLVRHLLSMSAGFPTDDPWADRQESLTALTFDALIAGGLRLVREPGSGYEYSNLGFALAGRILERLSGMPFPQLVTERLLEPLGLTDIGFDTAVHAPGGIAVGHVRRDDAWQPEAFSAPGAFSSIGGVFATPRALATWTGWLARAWRDDTDDAVLSRASRLEMQSPQTRIGATTAYGFGLVVDTHPVHGTFVAHSGGYPGYGAHMRWHAATGTTLLAMEAGRYSGAFAAVTAALAELLDAIAVPDALPNVWPETLAARETVEQLARHWDDETAAALFSENVDLDEPLPRRRLQLASLAEQVGLRSDSAIAPLLEAGPTSTTAAQLQWTIRGETGALHCRITMTPEPRPRVQVFDVRLG
jgi:CubicO group peptidase (beta-lactamase class C family)